MLASQPGLRESLVHAIVSTLPGGPGGLGDKATDLLTGFVDQRTTVGLFGLAIGLYSGWNWMNALRDSLTALWGQNRSDQSLPRLIAVDLLALLGLSAALLVSFTITISGTALGGYLLRLAGLDDTSWGHQLVSASSVPLALVADWLVFLWVLTRLPRQKVGVRSAVRGAIALAVGFELLKLAGGFYLRLIGDRRPASRSVGHRPDLLHLAGGAAARVRHGVDGDGLRRAAEAGPAAGAGRARTGDRGGPAGHGAGHGRGRDRGDRDAARAQVATFATLKSRSSWWSMSAIAASGVR